VGTYPTVAPDPDKDRDVLCSPQGSAAASAAAILKNHSISQISNITDSAHEDIEGFCATLKHGVSDHVASGRRAARGFENTSQLKHQEHCKPWDK
jgi:hypothetical protein